MHPIFQALAALGVGACVWEMIQTIRTTLSKRPGGGGDSLPQPPKLAPPVRRARSDAQIAAFENTRAKRAANLSAAA